STSGEARRAARAADAAVDGFVVWTTADDDPVLDAVMTSGLPAAIHAGPHRPGLPVVGIDDRAAAAAIGRVVFAGARRPAVLSFPLGRDHRRQLMRGQAPTSATFPVTRHRWQGFADEWSTHGGAPDHMPHV